jgi:retron-type reverse transcriptase
MVINIQRKKGSLTPGVDPNTVDSISLEKIKKISSDIRLGTFTFSRVRRKWIPKMKIYKPGQEIQMRPLGVPNFNDRLVQEAIHRILESIYEPIFER